MRFWIVCVSAVVLAIPVFPPSLQEWPVVRNYTVSVPPGEGHLRITVKKVFLPPILDASQRFAQVSTGISNLPELADLGMNAGFRPPLCRFLFPELLAPRLFACICHPPVQVAPRPVCFVVTPLFSQNT